MGAEGLPVAGLLRSRAQQTLRAAAIPAGLIAGSALAAVFVSVALIASLPLAIIVGIFIMISRALAERPVIERGVVAVRDGSIVLGGRRLCARDAVTSGTVVPGEVEGMLVRLERKHGIPIDLVLPDLESARATLVALELDPEHAVGRFHILAADPATFRRRIIGIIVAVVTAIGLSFAGALSGAPWLLPLLILPTVIGALSSVLPSKVTVGTDGITLRRFGREQFISLDGIVRAIATEGEMIMGSETFVVRLLDAEGNTMHELLVDQKKQGPFTEGMHQASAARARALAERIEETIRLRAVHRTPFDRATLARGDRDPLDWVRELRGLLARAASFRDAGPPTEDALLAIVEDGSAEASDRAAAAIAVSRTPKARARLRVAADVTAAPKLRVALEAALEDDDEKLSDALRSLGR